MNTTTTRRVLLLSSDDERRPLLEESLVAAGYEIRRCVETESAAFPCTSLQPGGRCPLDDGLVDVALDVRHHPWPTPTSREVGVRCALRERVPVAIIGRTAFSPFDAFADVTVEGDVSPVEACERAIAAMIDRQRAAACDAVVGVLRAHDLDRTPVTVSLERRAGEVRVRVVARIPRELRTTVVVRVGAAVRALDQRARAIKIDLVAD